MENTSDPNPLEILKTTKSAYFFVVKKPIATEDIASAFARILGDAGLAKDAALQQVIRETAPHGKKGGLPISFLVFPFEEDVPFFDNGPFKERKYAFVLLAEIDRFCIAFKRHVSALEGYLEQLETVERGVVLRLFASEDTAYQRLRLRNMSASRHVVRSRTLEADDLAEAMSPLGANRSIPRGLRLRVDKDIFSLVPNTSHVTKQEGRVHLKGLLEWAAAMVREIKSRQGLGASCRFLERFAADRDLASLPADVLPVALSLGIEEIFSIIDEEGGSLLRAGTDKEPPANVLVALREWAAALLDLEREDAKSFRIMSARTFLGGRGKGEVGRLRVNAKSLGIQIRILDEFDVRIGSETESLGKWLNRAQSFHVTFSEPQFAYFDGSLFEDRNLRENGNIVISCFETKWDFTGVDDEKGNFTRSSDAFSANSIFAVIERKIAADCDVLVCDDLGDEWADFIGVRSAGDPPTLSFYHAKFGQHTLSASKFSDVVAQGLKNLSHIYPTVADLEPKVKRWGQFYNAPGVGPTRIRRLRGTTTLGQASQALSRIVATANVLRRVCLVTSFVSKSAVEAAFDDLKAGRKVKPQIIQLLWLLTSFIGTCLEAGAQPRILCPEEVPPTRKKNGIDAALKNRVGRRKAK